MTAEASLYFHTWQTSPVEHMAITKEVCGELQRLLSTIEDSYLSLKLQGYRHLEAKPSWKPRFNMGAGSGGYKRRARSGAPQSPG